MSPSSDIETLFDHFGGKSSGYQEIGRENEASSARTRWPLLVTLDLKQPSIPAIVPRRTPDAAPATPAVGANADGSTAGAAAPDEPGKAAATAPPKPLKGSIFTRAHRHSIPPVAAGPSAHAPRGGERFAPPPIVGAAAESAASTLREPAPPAADAADAPGTRPSPSAPAAAGPVSGYPDAAPGWSPTAFARLRAAPVPDASQTGASPAFAAAPVPDAVPSAPPFGTAPPLFVRGMAAGGTLASAPPADPVSRAPAFGAPAFGQPASSAPTLSQPASGAPTTAPILGRLFDTPPAAAREAAAPGANAQPAALASVFERLRRAGAPQTAQATSPHSWLTNGPRRS